MIAIVRPVTNAVAVPALPFTAPTIVLENVLTPAIVCADDKSAYAPTPAIGMIEVAVPPAPPVPVP